MLELYFTCPSVTQFIDIVCGHKWSLRSRCCWVSCQYPCCFCRNKKNFAHKKTLYKTKKYRWVNKSHTSLLSTSYFEYKIVRSQFPLRIMRQCSVWTIQTLKMVWELCVQRWTTDTINKHCTGDVVGVV